MRIPGLLEWTTGFQKQTHCLELRKKNLCFGEARDGYELRLSLLMLWNSTVLLLTSSHSDPMKYIKNK